MREAIILKQILQQIDINDIKIITQESYDRNEIQNTLYIDNDILRKYAMKSKNDKYQIISTYKLYELIFYPNKYMKDLTAFCNLIGITFKRIAIYNRNTVTQKIIDKLKEININFDIIQEYEIGFSLDKRAYVIEKSCQEQYEVVITGGFDTIDYNIIQNNDCIYHLQTLFRGYMHIGNMDIDIINNILPILKRKNVKIMITEVPQKEINILRLDEKDVVKYGINQEYKKVFGETDNYLKVPFNYTKGYCDYTDYSSKDFNLTLESSKQYRNICLFLFILLFIRLLIGIYLNDFSELPDYIEFIGKEVLSITLLIQRKLLRRKSKRLTLFFSSVDYPTE